MSGSDRSRLLARVRQLRRSTAAGGDAPPAPPTADRGELHALETQVAHLEQLLQGLQDSVHRESSRLERRITELEEQVQPGAMGRALDQDARQRGL